MTPLLETTGWYVWSEETKDSSSAWGFYFLIGYRVEESRSAFSNFRTFAVRSRK
jgi:hypothetical protein